jgi:hypothetical protein
VRRSDADRAPPTTRRWGSASAAANRTEGPGVSARHRRVVRTFWVAARTTGCLVVPHRPVSVPRPAARQGQEVHPEWRPEGTPRRPEDGDRSQRLKRVRRPEGAPWRPENDRGLRRAYRSYLCPVRLLPDSPLGPLPDPRDLAADRPPAWSVPQTHPVSVTRRGWVIRRGRPDPWDTPGSPPPERSPRDPPSRVPGGLRARTSPRCPPARAASARRSRPGRRL